MIILRFVQRVWRSCVTCGGTGSIGSGKNKQTCAACNGAGGIDTKNI